MSCTIFSISYYSLINYFNYACFPRHELLGIRFNSLSLNPLHLSDLYVPQFVTQSLLDVSFVFFQFTFAEVFATAFTVRDGFR